MSDESIEKQLPDLQSFEPVPWLQRAQIGNWQAFIRTVKMVFLRPADFFASLANSKAPVKDSLWFYLTGTLAVILVRIAVDLPVMVVSAKEIGKKAVLKGFFGVLVPEVILTIIGVWIILLLAVWAVGFLFGFRAFSGAAAVVSYSVPVVELAFLLLTMVFSITVRGLQLAKVSEQGLTPVMIVVSVCIWVVFIHWISICVQGIRRLYGATVPKAIAVMVLAILLLGVGRYGLEWAKSGKAPGAQVESVPLPGKSN